MNLRDLQYLEAVAEHKNFRRAAEECNVSQPTLSMQIKKMEEYLQVTLIERNNNNLLLTEAGASILNKAKEINSLTKDIKVIAETFRSPFSGNIRIGAFPTLAPYYFPKVLPEVRNNFSDLKIFLAEEKTDILIGMLKDGKLDAAFLALPLNIEDNTLEIKSLFFEKFYLAVYKNHHLADRKEISIDDIKNEHLLLLEDGHCLRDQALEVCKMAGAMEDKTFRATSLGTLRYMVADGMGITLIPELAKRDDDGITYIKIKDSDTMQREIGLVWRKESPRKQVFEKLVELL